MYDSKMKYITILAIILSSLVALSYGQLENNVPYYQVKGICSGQKLVEENVYKPAKPYTTRTMTYTWRGHNAFKINCIDVENRMNKVDGGSVTIVSGGIGQSEISMDLKTKSGKGMDFNVRIYGEPIRTRY